MNLLRSLGPFARLLVPLLVLAPCLVAQQPPQQPDRRPVVQQQTNRQDPASKADETIRLARGALQAEDFATAMQLLLPLAQQGHPVAQSFVASMHQKGQGVPRNPREAQLWYTRAALQRFPAAMFMLGQMYYNGDGIEKDLTRAADLFLLTAVTGDADGQWAFGICVAGGEGRKQDLIEGGAWLTLAAEQGHEGAKKELAGLRLDEEGRSIVRNIAAQFADMIAKDGFDPQKLPRVPVPEGMEDEAGARGPDDAAGEQKKAKLVESKMVIDAELLPTGDMRGRATISMPPDFFRQIAEHVPNPRFFLRDMKSSRSDQELAKDAAARYDAANSAVILDLHMLGSAHNLGDGRWEWQTENHELLEIAADADGRQVAKFAFALVLEDEGMAFRGTADYRLPAGVTEPRWEAAESTLRYGLPYDGPRGKGRLRADFAVRDRIMSCLYKVYGMNTDFPAQWVAKAVFTNTGDGPITDLRVRFRLGDYSELDLWQKFPEVIPGQTAVAVYHPVLKKAIADLTSATPANLVAEWRYVDGEGNEREDSDGGRISILGRHEFLFSNLTEGESTGSYYDVFSNAEFVAAWVTRDDPVVKQFAAAANKAAGGAGARYSDEAAIKVMKACYELWQANDFTYQGPVGLTDPSLSFDNKLVQDMKFPRDVIRDRSGTCIELTALYCAMAHAVGLQSYMMLVPGHAFPVIELPGGGYLPVECTGVAGGKKFGSAKFEDVVKAANQTYEKWAKQGLVIEVDIDDAWLRGVSNPELAELPPDILKRWGIVLEFDMDDDHGGGVDINGRWAGTAVQPVAGGGQVNWQIEITFAAHGDGFRAESAGTAQVRNAWGGADNYRFDQSFEGGIREGRLEMRGTSKTLTVNGQAQRIPTDTLILGLQDGRLVGQIRLPDGNVVKVDVQKRG